MLLRQPQADHRLGIGGDELGGDLHLLGVGGQQAGDLGDGRIVAAGAVVGRSGERRRE
jgi:hypothetical protein